MPARLSGSSRCGPDVVTYSGNTAIYAADSTGHGKIFELFVMDNLTCIRLQLVARR